MPGKKHTKITKKGAEIQIGICKLCGQHQKDKRRRLCVVCTEKMKAEKENPIAYTIKDKNVGDLDVLRTANAWWLDQLKVQSLIDAFKMDATVDEAIYHAGITLHQYKYFVEQHPKFSDVRKACRQAPKLKARHTIIKNLDNPGQAQWYLTKKLPDEFGDKLKVEERHTVNFTKEAEARMRKYKE